MSKKFRGRRSAREGLLEKVHRRRSTGKSDEEGPLEKKLAEGCRKRGPVRKVAGKVALIPCEKKNNSLIFID